MISFNVDVHSFVNTQQGKGVVDKMRSLLLVVFRRLFCSKRRHRVST